MLALSGCGGGSDSAPSPAPVAIGSTSGGTVLLTTPAAPLQLAGDDRPFVFNAPQSAQAGDTISLQGANFGSAPVVVLEATRQPLRIVNRVGDWLAVQIPVDAAPGIALRVIDGAKASDLVWLDAPQIHHFDALATAPGGRFRIFGRNLMRGARTPTVLVGGKAATVETGASDAYMLTVKAPVDVTEIASAPVSVDNGNGFGASASSRGIQIVGPAAIGTLGGQAGWLEVFAPSLARVVNVDCSGNRAVGRTLTTAVAQLKAAGGGVIALGAGTCLLERGVELADGIILQGAGQTQTELRYQTDYPVMATGLRAVAIRNLTLTNAGSAVEGPMMSKSSFAVLQNVTMNFGTARQAFFDGNTNMLVSGCTFNQTGSIGQQSPYQFVNSRGLLFDNNLTRMMMGSAGFERISDSAITNSQFRRDAARQSAPGIVHVMTIDFAARIAITGNIFDTDNGIITDRTRNDGEAILTEGGGASRTESVGRVQSATATTLTDSRLSPRYGPYAALPANYGIAIVGGRGAGQTRMVTGFASGTVTVDRAWDVIPDATSTYASFVWGLEKALIRGNSFHHMPRGIWLYQTAIRDVALVANSFTDSGSIYLRSYQKLDDGMFDPIYNVSIEGNTATNPGQPWPSNLTAVFVNADARAFGIAMLGLVFRGNSIVAHNPPVSLSTEEYAGMEGYSALMRVENYGGYESSAVPRILGTIFQGNSCTLCDYGYRIGTGTGGTVISGAKMQGGGSLYENWKTTAATELALGTVIE